MGWNDNGLRCGKRQGKYMTRCEVCNKNKKLHDPFLGKIFKRDICKSCHKIMATEINKAMKRIEKLTRSKK